MTSTTTTQAKATTKAKATASPTFLVVDRRATQADCKVSAINPRYLVVKEQTGETVDSFTTRKAAQDAADLFSAGVLPEALAEAPAKETAKDRAARILAEAPQAQEVTKAPAKAKAAAPAAKATKEAKAPAKAKAAAAPAAGAAREAAAAARFAALPEAKREQIAAVLPQGYSVVWPKGAWSILKATTQAPAESSPWLILCHTHGTTKAMGKSTEGDALGKRDAMPTWCPGCAKEAKTKATRAAATKAKASAEAQAQEVALPASVASKLPKALGGTKPNSRSTKATTTK